MSVARLVVLAADCAPDTTTKDLVDTRIMPATAPQRCRFTDLLPAEDVGEPEYFVSHRWQMQFATLVSMLVAHVGPEGDLARTYVWLDVAAVNQHTAESNDFQTYLPAALGGAKQTLLCLDALGRVLTRIWCLYEVWATVNNFSALKLRVLMSGIDAQALQEVYFALNVANAQAEKDEDRRRILDGIQRSIGASGMNQRIRAAMVKAAAAEARRLLPRLDREEWFAAQESVMNYVQLLNVAGEFGLAAGIAATALPNIEARAGSDGVLFGNWLMMLAVRASAPAGCPCPCALELRNGHCFACR